MHVGIDLGTTNSVVAPFDGSTVAIVPNALGENLTPSVIRLDARGTATIGRRAYRFLETDPGNTRGEFKRLMGTEERTVCEAAGKSFLPEELRPRCWGRSWGTPSLSVWLVFDLGSGTLDALLLEIRGVAVGHRAVEIGRVRQLDKAVERRSRPAVAGWKSGEVSG